MGGGEREKEVKRHSDRERERGRKKSADECALTLKGACFRRDRETIRYHTVRERERKRDNETWRERERERGGERKRHREEVKKSADKSAQTHFISLSLSHTQGHVDRESEREGK